MRLRAARAFSERVSGREIVRTKSPLQVRDATEEPGPGWFEEFANGEFPAEFLESCQMGKEQLINLVRNVWELECFVKALDSMETLSSLAGLSREYGFRNPPELLRRRGVCVELTALALGKAAHRARCGNIRAKRSGRPRRACNLY